MLPTDCFVSAVWPVGGIRFYSDSVSQCNRTVPPVAERRICAVKTLRPVNVVLVGSSSGYKTFFEGLPHGEIKERG